MLHFNIEPGGQSVIQTQSLIADVVAPSDKKSVGGIYSEISTKQLSVGDVCMLHSALLFEYQNEIQVGKIRTNMLWLGGPGSSPTSADFVPPDPSMVPKLFEELLSGWRKSFSSLENATVSEKISATSGFHHRFVSIHPFADGNGRIARFLLSQQARELLNYTRRVILDDRRPYFDALARADKGDYSKLEAEITQAILGADQRESNI